MSDLRDEKQPSTEELLDAQTHLWNHIVCFINSMSLKCAIELGIPGIIHKHDNAITLSELNKTLNINKSKSLSVGRLMRVLVHAKFFTKVKMIAMMMIIDMVVGGDDHMVMETQLFFDMTMMVLFCGKERTEKDWAKLFSEAGFTTYKIYPLLGLRSLIEVFP